MNYSDVMLVRYISSEEEDVVCRSKMSSVRRDGSWRQSGPSFEKES